ncbi:MAG: zinc ribbon domain-containing protein [Candidatus Hadarchaeia archaeon]
MNEHYTSKKCSRLGAEGKRVNQGLFKCSLCGYEINVDFNGAKNIFDRTKMALGNIPTPLGLVWAGPKPFRKGFYLCNTSGETEKGSLFLTSKVS